MEPASPVLQFSDCVQEFMARSKRNRRATNKLAGSGDDMTGDRALIEAPSDPLPEVPAQEYRSRVAVSRSTLFSAEFEAVIEIIAIDRVYRAMLERLGRPRLLPPPPRLISAPPVELE